jgi:hypothetical protein
VWRARLSKFHGGRDRHVVRNKLGDVAGSQPRRAYGDGALARTVFGRLRGWTRRLCAADRWRDSTHAVERARSVCVESPVEPQRDRGGRNRNHNRELRHSSQGRRGPVVVTRQDGHPCRCRPAAKGARARQTACDGLRAQKARENAPGDAQPRLLHACLSGAALRQKSRAKATICAGSCRQRLKHTPVGWAIRTSARDWQRRTPTPSPSHLCSSTRPG